MGEEIVVAALQHSAESFVGGSIVAVKERKAAAVLAVSALAVLVIGIVSGPALVGLGLAGLLIVGPALVAAGGEPLGFRQAAMISSIHLAAMVLAMSWF